MLVLRTNGSPLGFRCCSIPSVIKAHGAHLKASAAMVRLRLYDILALLPPKTYEGKYNVQYLIMILQCASWVLGNIRAATSTPLQTCLARIGHHLTSLPIFMFVDFYIIFWYPSQALYGFPTAIFAPSQTGQVAPDTKISQV